MYIFPILSKPALLGFSSGLHGLVYLVLDPGKAMAQVDLMVPLSLRECAAQMTRFIFLFHQK